MERSGLRFKKNNNKGCKITAHNKDIISANLGLQNHYSLSQSFKDFYGIGATICIGREMFCLPNAGFFIFIYSIMKSPGRKRDYLIMYCIKLQLFLSLSIMVNQNKNYIH